jgi:outer membrane lipoprotein-sorting protein
VNHNDARRAISERMDGERLSARATAALDHHLSTCAGCKAFESGAWRLREAARFGVAGSVPDLVEPIMDTVRREAAGRPRFALLRGRPPGVRWSRTLASLAAAVVIGLVAGSLIVGGPWRPDDRTTLASAADISAAVSAAASRLQAYQATFAITESDPTGAASDRQLTMSVWFRAPERFRLDVADHTPGAGTRFVADDLQLIVNGASSYQVAPSGCPVGVCPEREQVVRNRLPFSSQTPAPTDLILPVSTLVDAQQMQVLARGRLMGRDAIEVRLPFERARPLFPFLDLGGRWRPFFSGDRVDLWLDAHSWFPLRYAVYPAAGPNRDEWQLRFGLPDEPAGVPIFEVRALSIAGTAPPASTFRIPHARASTDEGGRTATIDQIRRAVAFDPVTPPTVDGLDLYRAVLPDSEGSQAVLTYASGLSWLKIGETRARSGEGFFGPVGLHAQQIDVAGVGSAYYEPASARHGRRLAIHTAGGDLYLETNLSRDRLLGAAAMLDVRATPVPPSWLTSTSPLGETRRVDLEEATTVLPFTVLVPPAPPDGFTLASAEVVTVDGAASLNVYYQREETDFDAAGPLRLHEEAERRLPPASAARQFGVSVRGTEGRWTPGRHQLEWVENGVYYSLDARTLELQQLLDIAASMTAPVVATASPSEASPTPTTAMSGSTSTPAP